MNNKIAMVNKDLHTRLFEQDQEDQYIEPQKIYTRHQLPPQLMLKNMIKKGLTNTQHNFMSRPKTATTSNFRNQAEDRHAFSRSRQIESATHQKRYTENKSENTVQSYVDVGAVSHPQEFDEFKLILNKMKWQRDQQLSRKKIKLQRYSQKKFTYAWKKLNVPK